MASIKTLLNSVKRDSEYVMVELPKRSEGKYNIFFAAVTSFRYKQAKTVRADGVLGQTIMHLHDLSSGASLQIVRQT